MHCFLSSELQPESTLNIEVVYDGKVQSLEHVVITAGLYFDDISEDLDLIDYYELYYYINEYFYDYDYNITDYSGYYDYSFSGFSGFGSGFADLLQSGSRGDIQLELTSPDGTKSIVLPYRDYDLLPAGYYNWPFMSVHFWGEDPNGRWVLTVRYRGVNGTVSLNNLTATFHGTYDIPEAVSQIPDECHQACARGCSAAGSQFCDACAVGYIRDAATLKCIDPDKCPTDYAIRNGYCYDSRAPEPLCTPSTLPPEEPDAAIEPLCTPSTLPPEEPDAAISTTEAASCLVMAITFNLSVFGRF